MKLRLPLPLRTAVMACFLSVSAWSVNSFASSIDVIVSEGERKDDKIVFEDKNKEMTHTVLISGTARWTVNGELKTNANNVYVKLDFSGDSVTTLGSMNMGDNRCFYELTVSDNATLTVKGTLQMFMCVPDYNYKGKSNSFTIEGGTVNATKLIIGRDGDYDTKNPGGELPGPADSWDYLTMSGGRLNVGKDGTTQSLQTKIVFKGGTLGVLDSDWEWKGIIRHDDNANGLRRPSVIFLDGDTFAINTAATSGNDAGKGKTITMGATLKDDEGKKGGFNKEGAGTLILTAANTYSGGTWLKAGVLEIRNDSALGTGVVTVESGTLTLGQYDKDKGTYTTEYAVSNTIDVKGDSLLNGGGAFAGVLRLMGGALTGGTLNLAQGKTALLQNGSIGNVLSGLGGVKKETDGTVLLTGSNSYEGGTEVAGGVLRIDNADALGTGDILLSGGTLDLAGQAVINDAEVTGTVTLDGGASYSGSVLVKDQGALTLEVPVGGNITLESGGSLDIVEGMDLADGQVVDVADGAFVKGDISVETGSVLRAAGTLDMDGILAWDGGSFDWSDRTALKVKGLVLNGEELDLTNGVSLVVGSSGVTGGSLTLGSAILGASADWSTETGMGLSDSITGLTVDTQGEDGSAYSISLNGIVTGTGRLTKTGDGVLTLGGANEYAGDTIVGRGSLYLGNDSALGTNGKLKLSAGTVLAAASGKSVSIGNNVELGTIYDESCEIIFGQSGQTDSLNLQGTVSIFASGVTLNTLSNTELSGVVSSISTSFIKKGEGALIFSGELMGVERIEVSKGLLGFGSAEAFAPIKTLNMASGSSLNLGDLNGDSGKRINISGNVSMEGASAYTGTLSMAGYNSRLTVTGDLQSGQIIFRLGASNAFSQEGGIKTLVTTDGGTAEIVGTAKDSIILNFDLEYLYLNMTQGGKFQLFSQGLTYNQGTIRNEQRQLIMLDESSLASDGSIVWGKIVKNGVLIDADAASKLTVYTPSGLSTYLGAESGTITVDSSVRYDLDGYDNYNLTPGKGTLVYKGELKGEESGLHILDYADVTENSENHSTGSVILSNNSNSYGNGTNIAGTTVVVDMSQDAGQDLSGMVIGNALKVNVLGTGDVEVVAGMAGGSHLILQAYGDGNLSGVNKYTYENTFYLSGSSILEQLGANVQELSGDITSSQGRNILANGGDRDFVLTGNIRQIEGGSLILENRSETGNLVLSGQGKVLSGAEIVLGIRGGGQVLVKDGYEVNARGIQLTDGNLVILSTGSLVLGRNGITGTGTVTLNGGTLTSSASWKSDATLVMSGAGQNILDTTGANVVLAGGVTGDGGFLKKGTGDLSVYGNGVESLQGMMEAQQGRLILLNSESGKARAAEMPAKEYKLNGDLVLYGGKGASLTGMIDANGHNVTFGDRTRFYLEVTEDAEMTGYIRNAGTITIGTGTQLHADVLNTSWTTEKSYTVFEANESIQGAGNLELVYDDEFAFVDVSLDLTKDKEVGLILTKKGTLPGMGHNDGTNSGAINAVVAPLAVGALDDSVELTGKLKQHMQKVSKMTATEYKTYLTDMGNSASSFYTALSAQVQDATQHINSVRNRVELINPVMYDDWTQGGIYNVWAGGINHYRDVKSGSEAPGYEMTSWGGELGCAIPLSQSFMIGVGFAYTFADVQVKDGWGNNDNDTYNVDLFARYRSEGWTITGVLTGGFTNTEFHRNQILKDEVLRANSSTDGNQFMGTLEVGYDFYLNEEKSWILQPLVNITAGRAKLDSLSETGEMKNAGLMIGSQSYNMFSAGVGAKIAYQYKNSVSDQPGRVELKAMYVNDMGDVDFKVNGRFMGAPGNGFDLKGVSNEKSAALVSAGWIAPISAYGQFFVDAGCEFRKDQNGVNTTVGFSFQF